MRLLITEPPRHAAGRRVEDRSVVREESPPTRPAGHRREHFGAGTNAQYACRRGRCRATTTGQRVGAPWLHACARLPLLASAFGGVGGRADRREAAAGPEKPQRSGGGRSETAKRRVRHFSSALRVAGRTADSQIAAPQTGQASTLTTLITSSTVASPPVSSNTA